MSSMLMNQQYILNKVTLIRNTHKTRSCTDQLMKMNAVIRGLREPTPEFPLGGMVQHSLTSVQGTTKNRAIVKNANRWC